jgi:hypothetical protein
VRPIRLDDSSPVPTVAVTDNSYFVDPYLNTVSVGLNDNVFEEIPRSLISARCGDGDGCVLRLLIFTDPSATPDRFLAATLVTDPTGMSWSRFDPGLSTAVSDGVLTDTPDESILSININNTFFCQFRENDSTANYRIGATSADPDDGVTCTLRMED